MKQLTTLLLLLTNPQIRNVLHHEMSGGIRYDYRTERQMLQAGNNRTLVDQDTRGWSVMLDTVQTDVRPGRIAVFFILS